MKIIASGLENDGTNSYHKVAIYKMRALSRFILKMELFRTSRNSFCSNSIEVTEVYL